MTRFADGAPVFHGMFRDDGPRGAVSPVVAGLWGGPVAANGMSAIPDVAASRAVPVAAPAVEASAKPSDASSTATTSSVDAPTTASGFSIGGALNGISAFMPPSIVPASGSTTSAKPAAKNANAEDSGFEVLNDLARRLRNLFGG
jgi:hypothetical protein